MKKTIDLRKTVAELVGEYPELKDALVELGFKDITKPMALNTVGKIMTIPKGAAIKGIDLPKVIEALQAAGFEIAGGEISRNIEESDVEAAADAIKTQADAAATNKTQADGMRAIADGNTDADAAAADDKEKRAALLQNYVKRLSEGDDLETVKKEFVKNFQTVDAAEIAKAEQALISGGTPVSDVQKLCDVHSALFHGATMEEKINNAEQAVMDSLNSEKDETDETARRLSSIAGHPVSVFTKENDEIEKRIQTLKTLMAGNKAAAGIAGSATAETAGSANDSAAAEADAAGTDTDMAEILKAVEELRFVTIHYARKGDLIYPLLNRTYGFSGPSNVMWGVDDEIRDELRLLVEAGGALADFSERLEKVVTRAEEMVYKENNILLPLCAQQFSEEDWMRIYYEMPAYETCMAGGYPVWNAAEAKREDLKTVGGKLARESGAAGGFDAAAGGSAAEAAGGAGAAGSFDAAEYAGAAGSFDAAEYAGAAVKNAAENYVTLGSGHMTPEQIAAVLNTIPMELSFIDENNINRYFNDGEKLFKRPDMAIDRDVFSCHPPKVEVMVRQIIDSFRSGAENSVDVWMNKGGQPVLVRYMAVRDDSGKFLGTLECVQKMKFAEDHFINA